VLVESAARRVTLTDDLQFGIDWFIKTRNNTSGTSIPWERFRTRSATWPHSPGPAACQPHRR
jgi:hypothetical protein